MSEIRINIDDRYLQAFLTFLKTLNYVEVQQVTKKSGKRKGKSKADNATEAFLAGLPSDSPLRQVIKSIRKGDVTAEDLIRESGYVRTDWDEVKEIGTEMDIPQTTEELLAQLTA